MGRTKHPVNPDLVRYNLEQARRSSTLHINPLNPDAIANIPSGLTLRGVERVAFQPGHTWVAVTGYDPSVQDEASARAALDRAIQAETERQRLRTEHAAREAARNVNDGNAARSRILRRSMRQVPQRRRSRWYGNDVVDEDTESESEYDGTALGQAERSRTFPQRRTRASQRTRGGDDIETAYPGHEDDDGGASPLTDMSDDEIEALRPDDDLEGNDGEGEAEDDEAQDTESECSNIVVAHTFPAGRTQGSERSGDKDGGDEEDGSHESDNDSELSELSNSQIAELGRMRGVADNAAGRGAGDNSENAEGGPRLRSGGVQGRVRARESNKDSLMPDAEGIDNSASRPQQGPSGQAQDDSDDGNLGMSLFRDDIERACGKEETNDLLDREIRRTANAMAPSGRIARASFTLSNVDAPVASRPNQPSGPAPAPEPFAAGHIRDSITSLPRDGGMGQDALSPITVASSASSPSPSPGPAESPRMSSAEMRRARTPLIASDPLSRRTWNAPAWGSRSMNGSATAPRPSLSGQGHLSAALRGVLASSNLGTAPFAAASSALLGPASGARNGGDEEDDDEDDDDDEDEDEDGEPEEEGEEYDEEEEEDYEEEDEEEAE